VKIILKGSLFAENIGEYPEIAYSPNQRILQRNKGFRMGKRGRAQNSFQILAPDRDLAGALNHPPGA
jgi:hypothetical protein